MGQAAENQVTRAGSTPSERPDGRAGLIFDIKRFAIHDGPGIRTTVFLKGCPLACAWCHNPESIRPEREHWLRLARCTACGTCVSACTHGAIAMRDGRPVTDLARCVFCGQCVERCPGGGREIVGRRVTVDEVVARVERDIVFYDETGGGVTFSGGEPLMQPEFLGRLLAACRAGGIHTAVDTTCYAPWDAIEALCPSVDLWLCDLKHADTAAHKRLTGVGNERVLENLRRLAATGGAVRIRVPLIPGMNDDEANLAATGRFIASLGTVADVDVLAYNEGGRSKLARLGRDDPAHDLAAPSAERMAAVAATLAGFGLTVRMGG